jgi:hypothetical protein
MLRNFAVTSGVNFSTIFSKLLFASSNNAMISRTFLLSKGRLLTLSSIVFFLSLPCITFLLRDLRIVRPQLYTAPKANTSHDPSSLAAVPAHPATAGLRRLVARFSPDRALRTSFALYILALFTPLTKNTQKSRSINYFPSATT